MNKAGEMEMQAQVVLADTRPGIGQAVKESSSISAVEKKCCAPAGMFISRSMA